MQNEDIGINLCFGEHRRRLTTPGIWTALTVPKTKVVNMWAPQYPRSGPWSQINAAESDMVGTSLGISSRLRANLNLRVRLGAMVTRRTQKKLITEGRLMQRAFQPKSLNLVRYAGTLQFGLDFVRQIREPSKSDKRAQYPQISPPAHHIGVPLAATPDTARNIFTRMSRGVACV